MKKFNKYIYGAAVVMLALAGCQKPDYVAPNDEASINSFSASLPGDARNKIFGSRISNDTVYVNIDYYYPIDSENEVDLSKMMLQATIPVDSRVVPSIEGVVDLSNPLHLSVVAGDGTEKKYVVVANKKGNTDVMSAVLTYEDFTGATQELDAITIGNNINFSLVPGTVLNNARVTYVLNRHSSGSITNGSSINLDSPVPFVVSSAGNAKESYTIQTVVAKKLAKGIRPGSAKVMFAKKLKADLGITTDHLTGGLAATGQYVVLNTRNENSVVLNALTGAKVGTIDLGAIRGSVKNFYTTADDGGNILVNNLTTNDGSTFNIWKISSITSAPESFISWNVGTASYGRKISVAGDITKNAIITAPLFGLATQNTFARWQVVNGNLVSQTPTIVTINGYTWTWNNADVVYTNPSNINSDYFAIGYGSTAANKLTKINGSSNNISASMSGMNANFVSNTVDYLEFNNSKYAAFNHINGQPWGSADQVFLIDTDAGMSGDPNTSSSKVWASAVGAYGYAAAGGAANTNATGDVALVTSTNGYFLYMYFMFTNGYVVGVQFDCVDL